MIHAAIVMFQLAFEGVRGIDYAGDIALDDLTFSTSCPKPGKKPFLSLYELIMRLRSVCCNMMFTT